MTTVFIKTWALRSAGRRVQTRSASEQGRRLLSSSVAAATAAAEWHPALIAPSHGTLAADEPSTELQRIDEVRLWPAAAWLCGALKGPAPHHGDGSALVVCAFPVRPFGVLRVAPQRRWVQHPSPASLGARHPFSTVEANFHKPLGVDAPRAMLLRPGAVTEEFDGRFAGTAMK